MVFIAPYSTLVGSNVKVNKHMVNDTEEPVPILGLLPVSQLWNSLLFKGLRNARGQQII